MSYAAREGHRDIAALSIERGADVTRVDKERRTALMYAEKGGHRDIAALLNEKSADVTRVNSKGMTALIYAKGLY